MENIKLEEARQLAKEGRWDEASELLNGYGIEYVSSEDRELKYINLGDTYDLTVCQENDDVFICSWGDWYEETESEICVRDNVVRCGYCSEFTPVSPEGWRETVCTYCGNLVGG